MRILGKLEWGAPHSRAARIISTAALFSVLGTGTGMALGIPGPLAWGQAGQVRPATPEANDQPSVAELEARIAAAQARADEANLAVQQSAEAQSRASDTLTQAQQTASEASARAAAARAEVEAAKKQLGQLVAAMYRENSTSFEGLDLLSNPEEFRREALMQGVTGALSSQADTQLQRVTALRAVASAMEKQAKEAVAKEQQAAQDLDKASERAREQARQAQADLVAAQAQREEIIGQLASARNVSVEEERQRQADIETQRQARESAAAQVELEKRAAEEAAKQAEAARQAAAAQQAQAAREAEVARQAEAQRRAAEEAARQAQAQRDAEEAARKAAEAEAARKAAEAAKAAQAAAAAKAAKAAAQSAPAAPSQLGPAVLNWARGKLGTPYIWGGTGNGDPEGYDCSGLIYASVKQLGGTIGRSAAAQYQTTRLVPYNQAQVGDLIFWSSNGDVSGIYHVAIYLGGGRILMAPRPGEFVREQGLYNQDRIMPFVGRL